MKTFFSFLTVIVIVLCACNQGQQMLKPVMQDVVADDPQVETSVATDDPSVYSQYDVDQDGEVNDYDFDLVTLAIGQRNPKNPRLDVDGNGIVDETDTKLVLENFGATGVETPQTPVATDDTPQTPVYSQYDVNFDGEVNQEDMIEVIVSVGSNDPRHTIFDFNGNGIIDEADAMLVMDNYGTTVAENPRPTPPPIISDLPEVSSLNATDLMPGERYRFQADSIARTSDKAGESIIAYLFWTNLYFSTQQDVPVTVPEGSPKIEVRFHLEPRIYQFSVDGVPAISDPNNRFQPRHERDYIVVEIIEKVEEVKARNGDINVRYTVIAIENLTHPDRIFQPAE